MEKQKLKKNQYFRIARNIKLFNYTTFNSIFYRIIAMNMKELNENIRKGCYKVHDSK